MYFTQEHMEEQIDDDLNIIPVPQTRALVHPSPDDVSDEEWAYEGMGEGLPSPKEKVGVVYAKPVPLIPLNICASQWQEGTASTERRHSGRQVKPTEKAQLGAKDKSKGSKVRDLSYYRGRRYGHRSLYVAWFWGDTGSVFLAFIICFPQQTDEEDEEIQEKSSGCRSSRIARRKKPDDDKQVNELLAHRRAMHQTRLPD
jgi:hypothetical protein